MKFLRFSLLIFWCLSILNSTRAQNIEVNGSVKNATENTPITNHLVSFMLPPLEVVFTTTTDQEGKFAIDMNYETTDSLMVVISTNDPCTGEELFAYVFPELDSNYVEFLVCNDSIFNECQAGFEYYVTNYGDSTDWKTDSSDFTFNTVYFYDASIGDISDWYWDFGDGTSSNAQNPIHTYNEAGEYNVTLSITGENCESSSSMYVYVGNFEPDCEAYFYYDFYEWNDSIVKKDSIIDEGTTVYFYDYSYGEISEWYWDFGDGNTSNQQNPIHTYLQEGEYIVRLQILGESCESEYTMPVFIGNFEPDCEAYFYYDYYGWNDSIAKQDSIIDEGTTLYFYDYSYGNITNWYWNFGDGNTSSEQNPIHTYAEEGSYLVSLSVAGENCESEFAMDVWVGNFEPNCEAMFDYIFLNESDSAFGGDSLYNDYSIQFFDYSYGNISDWYWDFGDGTSSNEQYPIHTYSESGEYMVSLKISGENCESEITMPVWIGNFEPECMAVFGYDYFNWNDSTYMDSADTDFMTIYFYDFSFGEINNWQWDFGDGNTSSEQNPIHTYSESGYYVVSLFVAGETCESEMAMDVIVGAYQDTIWQPESCMAMFFPVFQNDLNVEFINESFAEDETSYFWDFGDGTSSTEMNPIHQYNEAGEYLVILNLESMDSCTSAFEMYIYVDDYQYEDSLTAFFIPEFDGTTVTFHDMSIGDVWNRHWDFGDGTTSSASNPVHVYNELGEYTVTLGVGNANSVHTYTVDINLIDGTFVGRFGGGESTSLKQNSEVQSLSIYPLPFENHLNIDISVEHPTATNAVITTISGKVVFSKELMLNSGNNHIEIQTEFLDQGIYLLKVNNAQGNVLTRKLVK